MKNASKLFASVTCLLSLAACLGARAANSELTATVVAVNGEVAVCDEQGRKISAESGKTFGEGQVITAGRKSLAALRLESLVGATSPNRVYMIVGPVAELAWTVSKHNTGDHASPVFELKQWMIRTHVVGCDIGVPVLVKAGGVLVDVRGADAFIMHHPGKNALLCHVGHGSLTIIEKGKPRRVHAGSVAVYANGKFDRVTGFEPEAWDEMDQQ